MQSPFCTWFRLLLLAPASAFAQTAPQVNTPATAAQPVLSQPAASQAGVSQPEAAQPVSALPSTLDADVKAPASGLPVLSLDRAVQSGLASHPRLRLSHANVELSEARLDQARAPLLPQVVGTVGYQRATANAAGRGSQTAATTAQTLHSYDYFNAGITANQLVTDFGQTTGRLRAAQANRAAQLKLSEADRLDVVFDVEVAYFEAQAQKALLAVAVETLENQKRHLLSVQGLVEVGTRPPIDRVQAQADMQRAELSRVNALNAYAVAKARLGQTMGLDSALKFDVSDETVPAVPGEDATTEQLYGNALAARPDLQAGFGVVHAQELALGAAKAGYYPSVNVSANVSEAGNEVSNLRFNASVGANLTWPIYVGGATQAVIYQARANIDIASAQIAILRQQVLLDVEQARLNVLGARQALATSELLLQTTHERLVLAEGRYQTGVGSILELADAQLAQTTAQGQRVQSAFSLSSARAALLFAVGKGLP